MCTTALAPAAHATIYFAGVAKSGGEIEFSGVTFTPGTGLPGTFSVDCALIYEATVETFVDQEMVSGRQDQAVKTPDEN